MSSETILQPSSPDSIEFATSLPAQVLIRPAGQTGDWQELGMGPGRFTVPSGHDARVRVKNIDDRDLRVLVKDLAACPAVIGLNLAENRKVTNSGLAYVAELKGLTWLNLSSCSLTNEGMEFLLALKKLDHLDISYCNRITDEGIKKLKGLNRLAFLDLQGCVKVTHAGIKRIERRGLEIHH